MATTKQKPIDIAKAGPLGFRQLQEENNKYIESEDTPFTRFLGSLQTMSAPTSLYDATQHAEQQVASPLFGQETPTGGKDFWGNSHWDTRNATEEQFRRLGDIRAENQPWYSKVGNGIAKAGVLAGTTVLETAGLLYGALGQGVYNAATQEGNLLDKGSAWLHGLWNNPVTQALQKVNEFSEEWLPNYYTQDEQENPFSNIFTANFLGDKLIKNLGFMIGAFYGGIPASKAIGAIGQSAVKSARAAHLAEEAGMARRVADLTEQAAGDAKKLNKLLSAEHLTEAERGRRMQEGLTKIDKVANRTRAVSQAVGAVGSAINEGAIEAINNSKDWARAKTYEENARHEDMLKKIEEQYGDSDMGRALFKKEQEEHELRLASIEEGRAAVGNADLIMNIPILTVSNMYQLGKLYARGFDSTRREMGNIFNGWKLAGSLKDGTLKGTKKTSMGVLSALMKSNTEGMEEFLQRTASDAAGNAVSEAIERMVNAGESERSRANVNDYIVGFGKAFAENLGDSSAWEEYMIGALSSMIGMPVFGTQTKNAWTGKGPIGLSGGAIGEFLDYRKEQKHENEIAEQLNKRVHTDSFKKLYKALREADDYKEFLETALANKDKAEYKELEVEQLFKDINAAASSGHFEEFKELVGFNHDYTDQELEDIVALTTKEISPKVQRQTDIANHDAISEAIEELEERAETLSKEEKELLTELKKEEKEIADRIDKDNNGEGPEPYKTKYVGPFMTTVNGQAIGMNHVAGIDENGEKVEGLEMRRILEKRRQNLLNAMDDFLRIRNDIDIETDGQLDDEGIEFLSQIKFKILNHEHRSADMVDDLLTHADEIKKMNISARDKAIKRANEKKEVLRKAEKNLEIAKRNGGSEAKIKLLEGAVESAKKEFTSADNVRASIDNIDSLLKMLTEEKKSSRAEREAYERGYGELSELSYARSSKYNEDKRPINSDEAQNIIGNPMNAATLRDAILKNPALDNATKARLVEEVQDLFRIAMLKFKYNEELRKRLDPRYLNKTIQEEKDKLKKKQIDDISRGIASTLMKAENMDDIKQIFTSKEMADDRIRDKVISIVRTEGGEDVKKLLENYLAGEKQFLEFNQLAQKYTGEIKTNLLTASNNAWVSLMNSSNIDDTFLGILEEDAQAIEDAGRKDIADAIRQIIGELNNAKSATDTNEDVKKEEENVPENAEADNKANSSDRATAAGIEKLRSAASKTSEKKGAEETKEKEEKEEKEEEEPEKKEDTKESLEKEIIDAIKKSAKDLNGETVLDITSLNQLPEELKDRVNKYNENATSDNKIDDKLFNIWYAEAWDALDDINSLGKVEDEQKDDATWESMVWSTARQEEMQETTRVNFKSSFPTQFLLKGGGDAYLDYLVDNLCKGDKQQLAIKQLLLKHLAYQFMDSNYLGYYVAAGNEGYPPLYYLRSTDETVSPDGNPVTFIAIKVSDDLKNAINKLAFNGENHADEVINPVRIGEDEYQIVGVLSVNSQERGDQAVREAFRGLQEAITEDCKERVAEERKKAAPAPFVLSKYQGEIETIYTGRLERMNQGDDHSEKVSLYDFMTELQEKEEGDTTKAKAGRKVSSEWGNGSEFYFGVVVNHEIRMVSSRHNDEMTVVHPSERWRHGNNGRILLYVPKPDGKLYPIRCTRRFVKDWLDAENKAFTIDTEKFLRGIVTGEQQNQYLSAIVGELQVLFDKNAIFADKLKAKRHLEKFFIFGKYSHPIHIDGNTKTNEVSIKFGSRETSFNLDNSLEDNVITFFNALAVGSGDPSDRGVMFSLPNPASALGQISGRHIIEAGVLEVGLSGFYNFNSNIIIKAVDKDGNPVKPKEKPKAPEHFVSGGEEVLEVREYNFGDGVKKYAIVRNGESLDVRYDDSSEKVPVSEANLVCQIWDIDHNENRRPNFLIEVLNDLEYDKSLITALIPYLPEYADMHLLRDSSTDWVYIPSNRPGEGKIVKKSTSFVKELQEKINKVTQDPKFIKERAGALSGKKGGTTEGSSGTDNGPASVEETPAVKKTKPKKAGNNDDSNTGGKRFTRSFEDIINKPRKDDSNLEKAIRDIHRNRSRSGIAKKMYETLQEAEQAGKLNVDDETILRKVKDVQSNKIKAGQFISEFNCQGK